MVLRLYIEGFEADKILTLYYGKINGEDRLSTEQKV